MYHCGDFYRMGQLEVCRGKYEQKIQENKLHQTIQLQIYCDKYIYEDMLQMVIEDFPGGLIGNINFFSPSLTQYGKYKAFQYLQKMVTQNTHLSSITLCNSQNIILDSSYGLSEDQMYLDQYVPYDLYRQIAEQKNRVTFLSQSEYEASVRPNITMIYNPTLLGHTEEINNYIAFSLDQTEFFQTLRNLYHFSGELIILNENNQILASTFKMSDMAETINGLSIDFSDSEKFCEPFHYGENDYYLLWTKSDVSGWKYLSMITADTLNAEYITVRNTLLVIIGVICAFAILAANLISRKLYLPIRNLRKRLSRHSQSAYNDFAVINSAISFLEQQTDEMEKTLLANRQMLVYKLTYDLFHLHNNDEEILLKRLKMCGIHPVHPSYCVLIVNPDPGCYGQFSLEQQEYLSELLRLNLCSVFHQEILLISESYPQKIISILLNLNESTYQLLMKEHQNLASQIKQFLCSPLNLYISPLTEKLSTMAAYYSGLCAGLPYSFFWGYDHVFTMQQIHDMEHHDMDVLPTIYAEFESMIRSGQYKNVIDFLEEYQKNILTEKYSYQSVNAFLLHLFNIVLHCCTDMGVFTSPEKKQELKKQVEEAADFERYIQCLHHIIQLCYQSWQQNITDEDIRMIEQIKEYILAHCRKDISLATIAQAFNISSSHLSRLFKSVTGGNFSNFVIQVKLEKAAELLCTHPELSITEIEESLGYFTPTYFNKLFKQKFGVIPSHYRKQNSVPPQ